jgi:hypothetical protein
LRKEKSKTKHILGLKTHQHSNTARLVGNEVIFRGRGQTTLYGYPRPG